MHIRFFHAYTRWKLSRTFASVWLDQRYHPRPGTSTLYLANHHLWWDALVPLVLSRSWFKQRLRAVMERPQMERYPFFSKIGAFSIDRDNARSALASLDLAADWLNEPDTCLFLYPEGRLTDTTDPIRIEAGFLRITENAPLADVVPVAFHTHFRNGPKPELYIRVGERLRLDGGMPKALAVQTVQTAIQDLKSGLIRDSADPDRPFRRF